MLRLLQQRPELRFVWYDFWCLPQKDPARQCAGCEASTVHAPCTKDDRTAAETEYFQWSLRHALKFLNLQTTFVPLWGGDYTARAWCVAELLWGHDTQLIVAGLNEPDARLKDELDLIYAKLVATAV